MLPCVRVVADLSSIRKKLTVRVWQKSDVQMTTRTTFALVALVVLGFVIVGATRIRHTNEAAAQSPSVANSNASTPAPSSRVPVEPSAKVASVAQAAVAPPSEEVGTAIGNIRFEQQGAGKER